MQNFDVPGVYEALDLVMKNYPDKFTDQAKVEIDTLLSHCLDGLADDSDKFLSTLFITSLKNYIGETRASQHIYLKPYEIPQIQLFDILIREFPFVKAGHDYANSVILNVLEGKKSATILDVGIGQGTQIQKLIGSLADNHSLEYLKIIGVEPFGNALKIAETSINEALRKMPFKADFVGVEAFIEKMSGDDLINAIGSDLPNLIINESLALHHIQTLDDRNQVIQMLRRLNPTVFVLTEPNVDHYEPDFYRRFQNCYRHFRHVFQVIDELGIDNGDKNALKLFFGREIEDIIGKDNPERFEKHEPAFRWIEKLKNNGFTISDSHFDSLPEISFGVKVCKDKEGFLAFSVGTETILSIICAQS